jgi:hypothetical protein
MKAPNDLEKLLAKKYAEQLSSSTDLAKLESVRSEARNVLNQNLDALGFFNHAMLVVKKQFHTPVQQTPAGHTAPA